MNALGICMLAAPFVAIWIGRTVGWRELGIIGAAIVIVAWMGTAAWLLGQ